jgi:hypothetical protein
VSTPPYRMLDRTVVTESDLRFKSGQLKRESASAGPVTRGDTLLGVQIEQMNDLLVDQLARSLHPLHLERENVAALLQTFLSQGLAQIQPVIETFGGLRRQLNELRLPQIHLLVAGEILELLHSPIACAIHSHLGLSGERHNNSAGGDERVSEREQASKQKQKTKKHTHTEREKEKRERKRGSQEGRVRMRRLL